jgi:hypothetical protein
MPLTNQNAKDGFYRLLKNQANGCSTEQEEM